MSRRQQRFEDAYSLGKRKSEAMKVLHRFPTRVPVIVQAVSPELPFLRKRKFLVPADLKMGQFIAIIRSKLMLRPHEALFVMTKKKGVMPSTESLIVSVYHDNMGPDLFLYLDLYTENVFGSDITWTGTDGRWKRGARRESARTEPPSR